MIRPQFLLPIHHELVVDLFAGGGGASTGIEQAIGRPVDIAVNHDPEAVSLHRVNHPQTRHFISDVFEVDPLTVTSGQPVGLLWASPDCTFHSKARGGKPFRDRDNARRRRGLAGVVIKWAAAVQPRVICLENVEEFQHWGPLLADGTPCPDERDGVPVSDPMHTLPTKDRMGLVTVTIAGQAWAIVDIGLRMLSPRELYRAQGFPDSYVIDHGADGEPFTKAAQVRMCGNSVCPPMSCALVNANYHEQQALRLAA